MKELSPAFVNKENGGNAVFVEKVLGDKCQCIDYDHKTDRARRITVDRKDLIDWNAVKSEVRLEHLDLWFKVNSVEVTTARVGEIPTGNSIVNSILPLTAISTHDRHIVYRVRSGGKSFWLVEEDLTYLPMLNDSTDILNNFSVGSYVVAVCNNSCHGLIRGQKYIIKDIIKDNTSMFEGTLYIENLNTKEKSTTYPKNLKLIINEDIQGF